MAIYAISDLHGQIPADKPDDMTSLIVVGDICPDYIRTRWDAHYRERIIDGHQHQAKWLDVRFREWAAFLDVPIYATFGNHDFIGEKPFLWPVIPYVQFAIDDWFLVEGYKVWFYPYTPRLSGWALKAEYPEAMEKLDKVPDDIDILATHGPPLGAGDRIPPTSRFNSTGGDLRVGDDALTESIPRINPAVTICGHIHEGRGEELLPGSRHMVVNVSSLDDNYQPYANPFVDLTPYLVGV